MLHSRDITLVFLITIRPEGWNISWISLFSMGVFEKEIEMKYDLSGIRSELSAYDVNMALRPDGSVLLTVTHEGKRLTRVIDVNCSTHEIIRLIKFDLALESGSEPISEAVKYCNVSSLPTYSRDPIFRTRSARLWALRKLTNS